MCRRNKSNVLEEVDSSDSSELEYESIVESFGGLQPYLFEEEKPNLHQDSSKQLQVTGTVYIKKDTNSLDWCSCKNCHLENREIDCLCCQDVAAIDEQKFVGKKQFTFMFSCHKFPFMQAFCKYFYFLPTALYCRCFFLLNYIKQPFNFVLQT